MTELFVTGAGGMLGSVLMRVLAEQRRTSIGTVSERGPRPFVGQAGKIWPLDLCDPGSYRDRLFALAPKTIVHLAAVSQIAQAYDDPDLARAVNVDATVRLLGIAKALGARFVYASTDLVFDGEHAPYDEDATTEPCSLYGRSKLEAECHVLTYARGLVLRLPLMYGLPDSTRAPSFFQQLMAALREGRSLPLFVDEVRSPLWLDDAAHACIKLADSALTGVIHAGGPERLSRYELGQQLARALGVDEGLLRAARQADVSFPEPRPRDVSLDSTRYRKHFGSEPGRPLREALQKILAQAPSPLLS